MGITLAYTTASAWSVTWTSAVRTVGGRNCVFHTLCMWIGEGCWVCRFCFMRRSALTSGAFLRWCAGLTKAPVSMRLIFVGEIFFLVVSISSRTQNAGSLNSNLKDLRHRLWQMRGFFGWNDLEVFALSKWSWILFVCDSAEKRDCSWATKSGRRASCFLLVFEVCFYVREVSRAAFCRLNPWCRVFNSRLERISMHRTGWSGVTFVVRATG